MFPNLTMILSQSFYECVYWLLRGFCTCVCEHYQLTKPRYLIDQPLTISYEGVAMNQ